MMFSLSAHVCSEQLSGGTVLYINVTYGGTAYTEPPAVWITPSEFPQIYDAAADTFTHYIAPGAKTLFLPDPFRNPSFGTLGFRTRHRSVVAPAAASCHCQIDSRS